LTQDINAKWPENRGFRHFKRIRGPFDANLRLDRH